MIRINLLPDEVSREKNIQIIILVSLVIIAIVTGMYYYFNNNANLIEERKAEKIKKEKELASLQQVKKELEKQRDVERRLKRKYAQIDKLNKKRAGPVKLLNVVARSLQGSELFKTDDGRVRAISAWLHTFDNPGSMLSLSGLALDYSEIANFMSSIETHNEIKNVKLITSQKMIKNDNEFITFRIECQTRF